MSTPPSFTTLTRAEWAALSEPADRPGRGSAVRGLIPPSEVDAVYAPFSQLLLGDMKRRPASSDHQATYLVGVAGGVSVGKSTTAGLLQQLLAARPDHLEVGLVSTDGFLYPNAELERRGLLARKGCPESYDVERLIRFLGELKSGRPEVVAPVYSHRTYDVVADQIQTFHSPDVLIIEGVNVLDTTSGGPPFMVDFLDYSVYVDADEADIERWYGQRFVALCAAARQDNGSFYHHFATMSTDQIERLAERVWRDVNGPNLRAHVLPTRDRADLILEKGPDHSVRRIRVRNR